MNIASTLISSEERAALIKVESLDLGPSRHNEHQFVVGLDARPLVALFDAALCGSRVYELMTISRPADLFNYFYVSFTDIDPEILKYVQNLTTRRARFDVMPFLGGMHFTQFDGCFRWEGDDTTSDAECWLTHRDTDFWAI